MAYQIDKVTHLQKLVLELLLSILLSFLLFQRLQLLIVRVFKGIFLKRIALIKILRIDKVLNQKV